jgi:hypothetical protein
MNSVNYNSFIALIDKGFDKNEALNSVFSNLIGDKITIERCHHNEPDGDYFDVIATIIGFGFEYAFDGTPLFLYNVEWSYPGSDVVILDYEPMPYGA